MIGVARNTWRIGGFPFFSINAYLVDDILVDCGTRWEARRFLKELKGCDLSMVALTHCHPDHQGAARAICEHFKVPLACHEADRAAMEGRAPIGPDTLPIRISNRFFTGPAYEVARSFTDGDMLGRLRVVHAPGHTPGHCMFYREDDALLIAGDVMANMNFITLRPGFREPPKFFSHDPAQNRASMRRILEINPRLVVFGHGPPVSDLGRLGAFIERLS
ncbi:MAG: MBL fold metallo-hydrolase [Planctomycetota bacterium]|nr:MAG: MBL fold metallo-hydrolase [Planctomycetota bacterium]